MKVKDVMTTDVVTVAPEASLKDVARVLAERRISGLPVVDADGTVIGVVSEGDLLFKERGPSHRTGMLAWLLDDYRMETQLKLGARTAVEAMTAPARTIAPWRPVSAAAALMLEQHVNRLPVVRNGKLVGIVTRADLVRAFSRTDGEIEEEIREEIRRALLMDPERFGIEIADGQVTLAGSVDRELDADMVKRVTERVPGVVSVASKVTWRADYRRDG